LLHLQGSTAVMKMWYTGTQMKAYKYFATINLEVPWDSWHFGTICDHSETTVYAVCDVDPHST